MTPYKPKKICAFPACHRKTKNRYCDQCEKAGRNPAKGKKTHPFYNRKLWRGNMSKPLGQRGGIREKKLLETPYCEQCKRDTGRIVDVTGKGAGAVDHIIPWKSGTTKAERWELFTDFDNLQSLCKRCHASKSGSGR